MVDFNKLLRKDRIRRGQNPDLYEEPKDPRLLATGPIKAWFRRHSGEIYAKELTYTIREEPHHIGAGAEGSTWTVFHLIGGPTGSEGFVLADESRPLEEIRENFHTHGYWAANAGSHRYEECRIHVAELDRVLDAFVASQPDAKLYQD